MKNIVVGLGLLIILFTVSCTSSLPIVRDENAGSLPLILSLGTPLDSITREGVEISINYTWNGKKSEFEQRQNAVGGITYTVHWGKFAEAHDFDWPRKTHLKETGVFIFFETSKFENLKYYVTGKGRVFLTVNCSYQDKDGNEHKGTVGQINIPVIFTN